VPPSFEGQVVALAIEASEHGHELALVQDEAAFGIVAVDQDGNGLKGYG
jgi:hypothetical protein